MGETLQVGGLFADATIILAGSPGNPFRGAAGFFLPTSNSRAAIPLDPEHDTGNKIKIL